MKSTNEWSSMMLWSLIVLEFTLLISIGLNGLDFVLCLSFDHVRWWPCEVLTVFFCFNVRHKERCVENRVDVPLGWKLQLIHHRGYHLFYLKGPMLSGC